MSLLDRAVDRLAGEASDRMAGWLDNGISRGRMHVMEHPTGLTLSGVAVPVDELLLRTLDAAEEESEGLAEFGRVRFLEAVHLTGLGERDEARRRWLRSGSATLGQILGAGREDDARAVAETVRREKAWAAFERFAEKVGKTALALAVPMLLAAL